MEQCVGNNGFYQKFTKVPYLADFPHLAPHNFYPLGTIKQSLCEYQGRGFEEVQRTVQQILAPSTVGRPSNIAREESKAAKDYHHQ
jgi:hypothetical protein